MSEQDNERSAIDAIEHELYNPKSSVGGIEIHTAKKHRDLNLPNSWGDGSPVLTESKKESGFSFGGKLLMLSFIFLICAVSFSIWRMVSMRNVVSSNNIDMSADIAQYVEGGETVPLLFTLRNRNTAPLQNVSVTVLYKEGNGSQDEQEKVQEKKELGNIVANEYKKQDFSLSFYGAEGETRPVTLKLEYKVAGSNAVFSKVITSQVILRTPPVSVHIDGPSTMSLGQESSYTFVVKNNSATTSVPSLLTLTLPNSFSVIDASPKPIARSTTFPIKALLSGEEVKIVITGSFEGKQGEGATLLAKIGSVGENRTTIGLVYAQDTKDVALKASPITLTTTLTSEKGGSEAIRYNDRADITLSYENTSSQALEDVELVLKVGGDAPMFQGIDPENGYYDSNKKTITWNKAMIPDLAVLAPGARGTLRVTVPIIDKGENSPVLMTTFMGSGTVKGSDAVASTLSKKWGVQGIVTLIATTQYKNSSFENSGPVPPVPNEVTTYTARFTLSVQNTISTSRVSFTLPAYVTWRGVTSNPSVSYDSKTRTVTWTPGALPQGAVTSVDIGLAVKPSMSHVGASPSITSKIVLDADEDVSRAHLRTMLSPLTTALQAEMWPENPSLVVGR